MPTPEASPKSPYEVPVPCYVSRLMMLVLLLYGISRFSIAAGIGPNTQGCSPEGPRSDCGAARAGGSLHMPRLLQQPPPPSPQPPQSILSNACIFCCSGYYGIQQAECEQRGCCWFPVAAAAAATAADGRGTESSASGRAAPATDTIGSHNDIPWCFHPNAVQTVYAVQSVEKVDPGRCVG